MGRIQGNYCLKKKGDYYYYKLPSMKTYVSTHLKKQTESKKYVENLMIELSKNSQSSNATSYSMKTFKQYTKNYFVWDKCPHFTRMIRLGKNLTQRYCKNCYTILHNHILPTQFSLLKMNQIRRKDVLNLIEQLLQNNSNGVVNDCISVLSLIFNESLYREDIEVSPMTQIKKLKEDKKPKVPFEVDDYFRMFPIEDEDQILKLWGSFSYFLVDYIECNTGMRNCEVRCLKWKNVDFDKELIHIVEGFKTEEVDITGLPKNNKPRITGMCSDLKKMLLLQKTKYSDHTDPDDYVCITKKGGPLRYKSTRRHHDKVMETLNILHRGQHVLRHSFNSMLRGENYVSDLDIRTTTGWSDEKIQDNYTHTELISSKHIKEGQDKFWEDKKKERKVV